MEHEPPPDQVRSESGGDDAVELHDPAATVHLARFNVLEVDAIEEAIATHLGVGRDHIAPDGFVVVPEPGHRMRITWESSAEMDIEEFQAIVDSATAANDRPVVRATLPEPHGPIARPRRKLTRRARRAEGGETR